MALVAGSAAALATSSPTGALRAPCETSTRDWDPNAPLVMAFAAELVPLDANFLEAVSLETEDGEPISFFAASPAAGLVYLCVEGGLPPDADLVWGVRRFENSSPDHLPVPYWPYPGIVRFHTAPSSAHAPIQSARACREFAWNDELMACGGL